MESNKDMLSLDHNTSKLNLTIDLALTLTNGDDADNGKDEKDDDADNGEDENDDDADDGEDENENDGAGQSIHVAALGLPSWRASCKKLVWGL